MAKFGRAFAGSFFCTLVAVVAALSLGACTGPRERDAIALLKQAGYTQIEISGGALRECSMSKGGWAGFNDVTSAFQAKAVNAQGNRTSPTVCCGGTDSTSRYEWPCRIRDRETDYLPDVAVWSRVKDEQQKSH